MYWDVASDRYMWSGLTGLTQLYDGLCKHHLERIYGRVRGWMQRYAALLFIWYAPKP